MKTSTSNITMNRRSFTGEHESKVRARAYELYELRGRIDGNAEKDWLDAEAEVKGNSQRKPAMRSL